MKIEETQKQQKVKTPEEIKEENDSFMSCLLGKSENESKKVVAELPEPIIPEPVTTSKQDDVNTVIDRRKKK